VRAVVPWLIGIAVAAIAVVAVIDAVRGSTDRGDPPIAAAPSAAPQPRVTVELDPAALLRSRGASGTLVYVDNDCRTGSISIPELVPATVTAPSACEDRIDSNDWITVGELGTVALPGCTAGSGTPAPRCHGAALATDDVERALRPAGAVMIAEAAWLGDSRLAAIIHDEAREVDLLALFERRELVARPALVARDLSGLSVSPRRTRIAVRAPSGGVYVLDRDGRFALPGRFRFPLLETRAIAWSPDDRWAALATRGTLYLVETDPSTREVIDLPLSARALEWR
jgi:hypothetical protein